MNVETLNQLIPYFVGLAYIAAAGALVASGILLREVYRRYRRNNTPEVNTITPVTQSTETDLFEQTLRKIVREPYTLAEEAFVGPDYGDRMSFDEFMDCVNSGCIAPDDGTLGEVLIDNLLSNICVSKFSHYRSLRPGRVEYSLEELAVLQATAALSIDVIWYNK